MIFYIYTYVIRDIIYVYVIRDIIFIYVYVIRDCNIRMRIDMEQVSLYTRVPANLSDPIPNAVKIGI